MRARDCHLPVRLEDMDRREGEEYLTRSIGSTASDAALPEQAKAQIQELLETEPYLQPRSGRRVWRNPECRAPARAP